MKSEVRSQKSEVRNGFRVPGFGFRVLAPDSWHLAPLLLLVTCHLSLVTAFGATHITGTYNLGTNPSAMATVNGTPEYGLVFVQRNKLVTYNGVQYGTQVVNGYLNASGQLNDGTSLWLDLIPSATASPADSYYVVTVNIQGTVHSEIWVVPDTATIDVALVRQAQPLSPAAPASFYQVVQQAGSDLPQRLKLNMTGTGVACADNAGASRTDCTITAGGGEGGAAPIASANVSGTVKTDATAGDPVVYLKTSSDTLLAGKANSSHGHAESEVTNLPADLAGKAALSHTHAESDVTNLAADLAGKVPTTRTVSTTGPLAGGGALSGNLTLSIPAASGSQDGYLSSGNWTTFNSKENALTFNSPLSRAVNTISCPTCELTGNKNTASGYAGLTASSKLNASQGQEVWSVADLTDYSATSGAGATALKTTITTPSSGQCLTWSGSDWVNGACSGGSSNHNLLSATHPDTVAGSPALGDLLYANSTPAWTKLAGNTTTTKKYLGQTGSGSVSAAPAWSQVAYGDLSGTPQLANTISQVAHKWLDSYVASTGNFTQSQPACGDLSNAAASCSTDATNATNITSGTLPSAQLPNPAASAKGGVRSKDCTGTGHVLSINTDSTVTCSADAGGGGGGASTGDSFITISHDADLTGERVLTAGSGISVTDGGANSTATIAFNPLDSGVFMLREDFCGGSNASGGIGELGWIITAIGSSGGSNSNVVGSIPNLCIARTTTSSTTARGASLSIGTGGLFTVLGNTSNNWDSKFTFRMNATASTSVYIGYSQNFSALPSNFIGLRFDTSATSPGADAAFRFVVCSSGTCTAHGTTYTADTSFHTIRMRSMAAGQVALTFDANAETCFNSGGTGGCTASANIPTTNLDPDFVIVNQAGSAQTLDCDFFGFMMPGLSR